MKQLRSDVFNLKSRTKDTQPAIARNHHYRFVDCVIWGKNGLAQRLTLKLLQGPNENLQSKPRAAL